MTDEHKRKLAEGRKNAALLRRLAKRPIDIPPGHTRDEAMRMAKDDLAQQAEEIENETGIGAIDPAKLHRKDNEIQRHLTHQGPNRGNINITGLQHDKYHYTLLPTVDQFSDHSARAAVRKMIEDAKMWGYELVSGDMPEGREFKGNDAAGPTTARGIGDACLWRITHENYRVMQEYHQNKQDRMGQVEERLAVIASQSGVQARGGDVSRDPYLKQVFGAEAATPVAKTFFKEEHMRRGNIPGIPAPGVR